MDAHAQPDFATDDGKAVLLMKAIEDAGAWVTVQMGMLLPEIETAAVLQFQWTLTQHLLGPQGPPSADDLLFLSVKKLHLLTTG